MKPQHPINQRQVKELLHRDELSDWIMNAGTWVKNHLETVVIGALVAAVAVFGIVFFINGQKQKDLEASKLLAEAHQIFQQSGNVPAAQQAGAYSQAYAKFQAVVGAYEGTPQAQDAKLGMANAQFAQGKYAEAEREYAVLDSGDAQDTIGALAAYGKARALEAQGKAVDAQKAYQDAASRYPNGPAQGLVKAVKP
jgi:TolA-binding protein